MKRKCSWAIIGVFMCIKYGHGADASVYMSLSGTNVVNMSMSFAGAGERSYKNRSDITCTGIGVLIEPEYKGVSKVWRGTENNSLSGLGGYPIKGYPHDYCMGVQNPERDAMNSHARTPEWLDALARIGEQNNPLPVVVRSGDLRGLGNTEWLCGIYKAISDGPSVTKIYVGYMTDGRSYGGVCTVNGPPPQPVDCKVLVPATIDHGVKMIGGGPSRITATTRVECSRAATVTVGVMDKDVNLSYGGHTIASTMNVGAIGSESVTTTADPISEVSLISVVQTPSMGVGGIYSGSSVVLVTWD